MAATQSCLPLQAFCSTCAGDCKAKRSLSLGFNLCFTAYFSLVIAGTAVWTSGHASWQRVGETDSREVHLFPSGWCGVLHRESWCYGYHRRLHALQSQARCSCCVCMHCMCVCHDCIHKNRLYSGTSLSGLSILVQRTSLKEPKASYPIFSNLRSVETSLTRTHLVAMVPD